MKTRDIKKNEVRRDLSTKRKRNRKRKVPFLIYAVFILVLVTAAFLVLASTVLFNIKKFEIVGEAKQYTPREIIEASGVKDNSNMFWMKNQDVEEKIVENLTYIESAKVTKEFPDTLKIEVTQCREAYNVKYEEGYLKVSENGKILSKSDKPSEGLSVFEGFDPENPVEGSTLKSKDEKKDKIFFLTVDVLKKGVDIPIIEINMTDKYSIKVNFDDRIVFNAGSWSDMDYKIKLAESAISELEKNETGYLSMIGSNQVSFRTREAVEKSKERLNKKADGETEESTDETDEENVVNNDINYVED